MGSRALVDDDRYLHLVKHHQQHHQQHHHHHNLPPDLLNAALAWADHRHDIHINKQDHAEQEEGTAGPWHTSTHMHMYVQTTAALLYINNLWKSYTYL